MLKNSDILCEYEKLIGNHVHYIKKDENDVFYHIYHGTIKKISIYSNNKTNVNLICEMIDNDNILHNMSIDISDPNLYDDHESLKDTIRNYENEKRNELRETMSILLDTIRDFIECTLIFPKDDIPIENMEKTIDFLRFFRDRMKSIENGNDSFVKTIDLLKNGFRIYDKDGEIKND